VFGGGDGVCYAFDAQPVNPGDEGQLKTAWKFDCNPPEFKTDKTGVPIKYPAAEGPSEINSTPVFYKNRIYVATGQDPEHGEGVGHFYAIDATRRGDITTTGVVWHFDKIRRSISSAAVADGLVYIADFSGYFHCLDAKTGQLYWTHDLLAAIWGSPIVVDGKIYLGDEDGDVIVMAHGKEMKVLAEMNMGSAVYSTAVPANGTLFLNNRSQLFAIAVK